jgi:hypothetical protein
MQGYFYDVDSWLKKVEEKRRETTSEGARWWLERVRLKNPAVDF